MSDCTFEPFVIKARKDVGNVGTMMGTIASELMPARTIYNADEQTLTVMADFGSNSDLIMEVIGMYASQLEDTEPFHADTENCGDWFWRIKDSKYQQTSAILIPEGQYWNDGTEPVVFQPEDLTREMYNKIGSLREFIWAALQGTIHEDTAHQYVEESEALEARYRQVYGN